MERSEKNELVLSIQDFRLPKYEEIPNMGLYLDQVAKYISEFLAPLQGAALTSSMISNYVKKGLIKSPVKKMYYRDQIVYLFFIAVSKSVLSLEGLQTLIRLQQETYELRTTYEYFRRELENILFFIFGLKDSPDVVGTELTEEKTVLRNTIITVAHKVYLDKCVQSLQGKAFL